MQKLLLVSVCLLLTVSLGFAQGDGVKNQQGSWGWMFELGGLSEIKTGAWMGGLGGKYFIQDDLALRGGVSFSTTDVPKEENDPSSFGVNAGLQYNAAQSGNVAGYFGGMFSFTSSKATGSTESATGFVVAAIAGAEWFPWSSVSLSGEYQLRFTSSSPGGDGDATTTIGISSGSSSLLTLTFYVR